MTRKSLQFFWNLSKEEHLMKKRFLISALLALLIAALPLLAYAEKTGICGDNLTWKLTDSGVLTISGKGPWMDNLGPTREWSTTVVRVTIQSGATTIGDEAFYNCQELTSISIPSTVTRIGDGAFLWCGKLTSISIPSGVTQIGEHAFGKCVSLVSVTVPASTNRIGRWAFSDCEKLKSIYILNSSATICDYVFDGCPSDLTIYCYKGSTAEKYAKDHGIKVSLLKPVITGQPYSVTVDEGSKATFKVTALYASSYQWYYLKPSSTNWTAVSSNGTSATYTLTAAARHNGYQYRCKATNNAGTAYSSTATLTVRSTSKPTITSQPGSVTVNAGSRATFRVTATGADSYQWYYMKPNESTWRMVNNNGSSATYTLVTEARHNGNRYRCKVSNAMGDVWSNSVTLTVTAGKPTITSQPASVTVNEGQKATFKVAASGATSYQWYYIKPGESTKYVVTKNGSSATYTLTAAARHNGYKYTCKVSNSAGSVWSKTVTLTVVTKPVIIGQPGSVKVNVGSTAAFTVTADSMASYKWYYRKSSTGDWMEVQNNGTSATYRVTTAARHNGYQYRCKVSNSAGYVYSNIATLTVK